MKTDSATPTPAAIARARAASGLSQTRAALLVHAKLRTWQQWEAGDRKMHAGFWELFGIKAAALASAPPARGS